jgi:hypothetical protein
MTSGSMGAANLKGCRGAHIITRQAGELLIANCRLGRVTGGEILEKAPGTAKRQYGETG